MKTGRLEWNKLKQNQFNVYSSHSICIKNYCFFRIRRNMDLLFDTLLVLISEILVYRLFCFLQISYYMT